MQRERSVGIDLLRILGAILIVMTHVTPYNLLDKTCYWFIDINIFTEDIQVYLLRLLRFFGQIGNDIFIVSSAFLLTESKKCKYRKILYLFGDVCTWCVIYAIVFRIFSERREVVLVTNSPLSYWFITAYVCIYFLHPYLNILIDNLSKRQLLRLNIFMFSIWCLLQLVLWGAFYLTELVSMIVIYFIVAYCKKYLQNLIKSVKFNTIVCGISLGCILGLNYILPIIGTINDVVFHWYSFRTPLLILNTIALYCLFSKIKIKNRLISYLSSFSLLIYIIHGNSLIIANVYSPIFKKIYDTFSYNYIFWWCFFLSCNVLTISFFMALIYKKTLQKLVYKLCDCLTELICKVENWLYELSGGGV